MRSIREQQSQGSSAKLSSLGRAYGSLILTTITTSVIALLYLALTCEEPSPFRRRIEVDQSSRSSQCQSPSFSVSSVPKSISDPLFSNFSYIFAIFGGITNLVIFIRSILTFRHSSFQGINGSTLDTRSNNVSRIGTTPLVIPLRKLRGSSSLELVNTTGTFDHITITREWEVKVDIDVDSETLESGSVKDRKHDSELKKVGLYSLSNRSEGAGWMMCLDK